MTAEKYEEDFKQSFIANKDFNSLGTCWPDNEELHESAEYKQVFTSAQSHLKKSSFCSTHSDKERFPVSHGFNSIIKQNQSEGVTNTWGKLSAVFLLLTWYSLRILRAPWRKSYFKIKAYSGHFHHLVSSNFSYSVTQQLMAKLGYIYHQPNQTYLFHQQTWSTTSWRDALTHVGMDFYLVHVRCSLCSTKTGSLMPVVDVTTEKANLIERSDSKEVLKKLEIPLKPDAILVGGRGTQRRYPDFSRVEAVPNQYVSRDAMLRHHKGRGADTSGGPWNHRLQALKLTDEPSWSDEGADLYRAEEGPSSLIGADIRYPPNDLGINFNPQKNDEQKGRVTSSLPRTKDNYVTALPMSSYLTVPSKAMAARESRVESGYYSEWLHAPPTHLDPRAELARKKQLGEYGYGFPHKRPPADGQPNSSLPLYHEITDDKLADHHLGASSSRVVRR